jgi:hypothetical protein
MYQTEPSTNTRGKQQDRHVQPGRGGAREKTIVLKGEFGVTPPLRTP